MFEVGVSQYVLAKVAERYGAERTGTGKPSEFDFVAGSLAAAVHEFRYFDDQMVAAGRSVRALIIVDPFFGALVFTGVLVGQTSVEIADFDVDPDYWSLIDSDVDTG